MDDTAGMLRVYASEQIPAQKLHGGIELMPLTAPRIGAWNMWHGINLELRAMLYSDL
jgi:hypothetical protein